MNSSYGYRGRRYKSNRAKVFIPSPVVEKKNILNSKSLNVTQIKKKSEDLYRAFRQIKHDKRSRRQFTEDQQTRFNFQRFAFSINQNRLSKSITMLSEATKDAHETPVRISGHNSRQRSTVSNENNMELNSSYRYFEPDASFSRESFTVIQPIHHSNTFTEVSSRSLGENPPETNIRRQKTLVVKLPSVVNSEPESESRPDPFQMIKEYRTTISKQPSGLSDKIISKLKSINAVPTTPKTTSREQKVVHTHHKREATTVSVVSLYDNKSIEIPHIKGSKCQLVQSTPPVKTNTSPSPAHGGSVMSSRKIDILPSIGSPDLPNISPKLNEYKGSKLTHRTSPPPKLSRKSPSVDQFSIAHINQKRAIAQRRLRKSTVTKKQTSVLGDDVFLSHHFPLRRMDTMNTSTRDKTGKRLEYETDIRALLKQKTTLRIDKHFGTDFDFKLLTIEPWRRVPNYYKDTQEKQVPQFEVNHVSFLTKKTISSRKQQHNISKTPRPTERYSSAEEDLDDENQHPEFEFIIRNSFRPMQTVVQE